MKHRTIQDMPVIRSAVFEEMRHELLRILEAFGERDTDSVVEIADSLPKTKNGRSCVPGCLLIDKDGKACGVNFIDTAKRVGQIDGSNWSKIRWAEPSSEMFTDREAYEAAKRP